MTGDAEGRGAVVGFVVLAAGGSRRLGSPKQLVPFRGRTLLRHAAEVAVEAAGRAQADGSVPAQAPETAKRAHGPVVVVLGCEAERMRSELDGLPVHVAVNARWDEGVSGSIRAGLEMAQWFAGTGDGGQLHAVIFLTCDQPFVTAPLLRRMIAAFRAGAPIVACAYAGTMGVPALFGRGCFAELAALGGDVGAKVVIERHRREVAVVPFPEGEWDVDGVGDVGYTGEE